MTDAEIEAQAEAQAQKIRERADFIKALRDFATFLEAYPGVVVPYMTCTTAFANSREEMAQQAKAAPGWKKDWSGDWFSLRKNFGERVQFDVSCSRETVCHKVVTGTKVVPAQPEREVETFEWQCDELSLLAPDSKIRVEIV